MKPRSLLVLALLVAGLGAFLWFGRELPSTDELEARAKRVVLLEPEAVTELSIERNGRTLRLTREVDESAEAGAPSAWRLAEPLEAPADAAAVDGLVRRLVSLEKQRTLEDVSRADVGLAPPRARVTLGTVDGETVLEIGAGVPASSTMTLAVEGDTPVHIVPAALWGDLDQEVGDWRDKSLFAAESHDIDRIEIERQGERVELVKRDNDLFWIEAPFVDRADQPMVNRLLTTIAGLRAERFVDGFEGDRASLGLEPAEAVIHVSFADGRAPMRLEVGRPESEGTGSGEPEPEGRFEPTTTAPGAEPPPAARYLVVDGETVTSTAVLAEHAARSAAAWRSPDLVSGEVYELSSLEIEDAAGTTVLDRVDAEWTRDGVTIDFGAATDLLYEISGGSAARLVAADSLPALGEAVMTFRLVPGAAEVGGAIGGPEILEIFPPIGEETPARVSGREVIMMLSGETALGLREKVAAVRAAPLATPPTSSPMGPATEAPASPEAPTAEPSDPDIDPNGA